MEIHLATVRWCAGMPESNPMLRIIALRVPPRVRFKKKNERSSFRNRRFFCLLRAMHRTAQRQAALSSWYTSAHARPLGLHMPYFFLSQHPHTCAVCTWRASLILRNPCLAVAELQHECVYVLQEYAKYIFAFCMTYVSICNRVQVVETKQNLLFKDSVLLGLVPMTRYPLSIP